MFSYFKKRKDKSAQIIQKPILLQKLFDERKTKNSIFYIGLQIEFF